MPYAIVKQGSFRNFEDPDLVQRAIRNACSIKHLCTQSDDGREIEHDPDAWLESELALFHRGISLALLFLAGLLLVVEMIRHENPTELLILSGFLIPVALLGSQLSSAFFTKGP